MSGGQADALVVIRLSIMITVLTKEKKEVGNVTALNVDSCAILRMYNSFGYYSIGTRENDKSIIRVY